MTIIALRSYHNIWNRRRYVVNNEYKNKCDIKWMILKKCIFCHCSIQDMLVFVDFLSLPSFAIRTNMKSLFVFRDLISSPHRHLTKAHVASFSPLLDLKIFFLLFGRKARSRAGLTTQNLLLCFRAALQPRAVRLPQWEDAMYPNVLAVRRLDSMRGQEWRDGLSPWVYLT